MDDNKNQEKIHITREEYRQIKKKKKLRLKPWAFCIFLIFFLGLLASSIYIVYCWDKDNKKIKKLTDEINEEISFSSHYCSCGNFNSLGCGGC